MQSHHGQATQHNSRRPHGQPKTPTPPFTGDRARDDLNWDIWAVENGVYKKRKVFPNSTTPIAQPSGTTNPRTSSSTAERPGPHTGSSHGRKPGSSAARPSRNTNRFPCRKCGLGSRDDSRRRQHEASCLHDWPPRELSPGLIAPIAHPSSVVDPRTPSSMLGGPAPHAGQSHGWTSGSHTAPAESSTNPPLRSGRGRGDLDDDDNRQDVEPDQNYPCTHPGCREWFTTHRGLNSHFFQAHCLVRRPGDRAYCYLCSACGESFTAGHYRDDHEAICLPRRQPDGSYTCIFGCSTISTLRGIRSHEYSCEVGRLAQSELNLVGPSTRKR